LKASLSQKPAVLAYLNKSILPWKEQFVVAWAGGYPHLRNLNTSRVESAHAYLKTFVTNSTGDLLSVFNSLSNAIDHQIRSVHESVARDTIKTLVRVPKCFTLLLGKISSFALTECITQYDRLNKLDPTEACSNTYTEGVGIPCSHRIAQTLEDGRQLTPEDFHLQWHLKYNPETTVSHFIYQLLGIQLDIYEECFLFLTI
jgi:hypothetical protein